jgi:hypothetical protein
MVLSSLPTCPADSEDVQTVLSRSLLGCAISSSVAHPASAGAAEGSALIGSEALHPRVMEMVMEYDNTALLAFGDVREAQSFKKAIDTGKAQRLIGPRLRSHGNGDRKLSCEFISPAPEELKRVRRIFFPFFYISFFSFAMGACWKN